MPATDSEPDPVANKAAAAQPETDSDQTPQATAEPTSPPRQSPPVRTPRQQSRPERTRKDRRAPPHTPPPPRESPKPATRFSPCYPAYANEPPSATCTNSGIRPRFRPAE